MGGISINSGFYWGRKTGIYYGILGWVCDRLAAGRSHRRVTAGTPTRRGRSFSVKKSRQKIFSRLRRREAL